MGMVADMVRLMDHLDIIVLGSGDGDFTDIVELLQERGKRVEVIAFREHTAQKLIDAADKIHPPAGRGRSPDACPRSQACAGLSRVAAPNCRRGAECS